MDKTVEEFNRYLDLPECIDVPAEEVEIIVHLMRQFAELDTVLFRHPSGFGTLFGEPFVSAATPHIKHGEDTYIVVGYMVVDDPEYPNKDYAVFTVEPTE